METLLLVSLFFCFSHPVNVLKSKFYLFFRYLTNEGIEYLRAYLHLPPEIVPSTLKRAARSETARPRPSAMPRGGDASKSTEDRSSYRRAPGGAPDKKGDVGAGSGDVEFVSLLVFSFLFDWNLIFVVFAAWWIRKRIKTSTIKCVRKFYNKHTKKNFKF